MILQTETVAVQPCGEEFNTPTNNNWTQAPGKLCFHGRISLSFLRVTSYYEVQCRTRGMRGHGGGKDQGGLGTTGSAQCERFAQKQEN